MKKLLLAIALVFFAQAMLFAPKVSANGASNIPANCPNDYIPDFACINKKILNPKDPCQENKCPGDPGEEDPLLEKYNDSDIAGFRVRITQDSLPALINLIITTFLGVIALYALFRGIYVAGVKRTQATTDDALASVNKELTAIVVGFSVAFAFIFIIQVVFNLLGLGGITDLNVNFTGTTDPNSPQLVINGGASE